MNKIIIFYIVFSLFLIGCRSTAVETETRYKAEIVQKNDVSETTSTKEKKQEEEIIDRSFSENIDIVITTKTYDTDKPINPETGKPPLKEESTTIIKKNTDAQENITKEENTESKIDTTLQDNSTTQINIDQEEKQKEIPVKSTLDRFLELGKIGLMTLLIVLFGFGVWKIFRYLKTIK